MMASFVGASFGITEMIFFAPLLSQDRVQVRPGRDLLADAARPARRLDAGQGSPLKGVAMTVLGLLLGLVGTDINTGERALHLRHRSISYDGVEIVALALGLFGIAEFLKSVNHAAPINTGYAQGCGSRDMRPSRADLRRARCRMLRGTLIGSLCSLIPGTGPTIASFVAYAAEKKISKHARAVRHRRDRGRRLPGSLDPFLGAGRFHPDDEPRHSRRCGHGAAAGRADHPGHSRPGRG